MRVKELIIIIINHNSFEELLKNFLKTFYFRHKNKKMVSTRRTKAPSSSSRPSSPSPPPASPRGRKRTTPASIILRSGNKKNGEEDIPISTTNKTTKKHQNHGYEFGGPIGAICITILLPLTCYFLVFACNETTGCDFIESIIGLAEKKKNFSLLLIPEKMTPVFSLESCLLFLGWIGWCVILHALLPASVVKEGVDIISGESGGEKTRFRLRYKLNGFRVFTTTAVACAVGTYFGQIQLRSLHAKFLSLLTAGCAFAFALTTFLYVASFRVSKNDKSKKKKTRKNDGIENGPVVLANGGNTGNVAYDWFIGRELNPRFSNSLFDAKVFCELTPGLIGWLLLNFGFMHEQYARLGFITKPMVLVNAFQLMYVVDALWNEPAILTTMDVTTDGFGFMLVFGDLVWVPFTYSLQCRYILENNVDISLAMTVFIVIVQATGYYVFRQSNGQKNTFRTNPKDPSVRHLKSLKTKRGTNLLISGWWGIARHINYFGDWLMAWAWCLPCGFDHVAPYFYVAYFGVLLVHRDLRDGEQCELKYGNDWKRYCEIVRFRIIPYVY